MSRTNQIIRDFLKEKNIFVSDRDLKELFFRIANPPSYYDINGDFVITQTDNRLPTYDVISDPFLL